MKSYIKIFYLFSVLACSNYFFDGEFLAHDKFAKKFGIEKFSVSKFKAGTPSQRAKMVNNLVTTKHYVGKSLKKVYEDLGGSTGYFFSDLIPAYILNEEKKGVREVWQLVFIPQKDKHIVEKVVVHKKCCRR